MRTPRPLVEKGDGDNQQHEVLRLQAPPGGALSNGGLVQQVKGGLHGGVLPGLEGGQALHPQRRHNLVQLEGARQRVLVDEGHVGVAVGGLLPPATLGGA